MNYTMYYNAVDFNNLLTDNKYKKKDKKIFILNIQYKYPNSIIKKFTYYIENIFIDEIKYKQKNDIFKYKIKINITENLELIKYLKELNNLIYNKAKEIFNKNINYKPLIKEYSYKDYIEYLTKNPNKTCKEFLDNFKICFCIRLYLNEIEFKNFQKELSTNNLIKFDNICIMPQCYYIKYNNKLKLKNYCYYLTYNDKKYIIDDNYKYKYYCYYYDEYGNNIYFDDINNYNYIIKK